MVCGRKDRKKRGNVRKGGVPKTGKPLRLVERGRGLKFVCAVSNAGLLTQVQSFQDGAVTLDVAILEVVQQCAAFADESSQSSFCAMIFTVALHVLRQVGYTV